MKIIPELANLIGLKPLFKNLTFYSAKQESVYDSLLLH